ncbi:MAG TPA: Ig-like domain-containing protein [Phycisphaerae bacterium]|nr:Ig-like domain-containing protein [Phycisphaerae bacterium]
MHHQRNDESQALANMLFHCGFWLMLAIAVTGCDATTLANLGLGGAFAQTQPTTANPESYALIGARELEVTSDRGLIANDEDAVNVVAGSFVTTFGGALTLDEDGAFFYTAPDGFFGTDTLDYTIEVANGAMTGTVSIKVYPEDATPVS